MDIDRRILIVDGPDGDLQQLALELLGREYDIHYANDLDEAQLIASEADRKINVVVFVASLGMERVPALAARFKVPTGALIPAGRKPPKQVIAALAHHGVRWHLWDDPPDETIRFVISGVLFDHDPMELRYHLRVPVQIPARLEVGGKKSETTIRDIALGGACLLGGFAGEIGDPGELVLEIEDKTVSLPIRTAWSSPDENEALSVCGVSFREVDPEAGEVIDALLASVISRHQIAKPD